MKLRYLREIRDKNIVYFQIIRFPFGTGILKARLSQSRENSSGLILI